jgi:site-specific recombinase XerD
MSEQRAPSPIVVYLDQFVTQKKKMSLKNELKHLPDALPDWIASYLALAVSGKPGEAAFDKILLQLGRFADFYARRYPDERLSICRTRDVEAWLEEDLEDARAFAPATVNNHLNTLSKFCSWVHAQRSDLFILGNPVSRVKDRPLPPIEPHTLSDEQIVLLKNLWDRLERFHEKRGRRYQARKRKAGAALEIHAHARPWRDRAIFYLMLATGLRREELVNLDLAQVMLTAQAPSRRSRKAARAGAETQLSAITPEELRTARNVQLIEVRGKGRTLRNLHLGADARAALADYLEKERPVDAEAYPQASALFLRAASIRLSAGASEEERQGRLALRQINRLFEDVKGWYNGELREGDPRWLHEFHPHTLRHTFGRRLAEETGADKFELQRRMGHLSEVYLRYYTTPITEVAARYVEKM